MSSENVKVLDQFIDLMFYKGQAEAALEMISPDFVAHEAASLPYGGDWKGPDGFQQLLVTIGSSLDFKIGGIKLRDAEDLVASEVVLTMISRKDGRTLHTRVLELYKIVDGKILRLDVFYEDAKAVADLAAGRS